MISTPITKALNPAYRKFKPLRKDIENFKKELLSCIEAIALSDEKNESVFERIFLLRYILGWVL